MLPSPIAKRGFTLIELSIVLVIIGLIVGGVLMGRDLISAAAVRKEISQMSELETQIATFRSKFDCVPGDCANATALLGPADSSGRAITNGDGDFVVRSTSGGMGGNLSSPECLQGGGADEPSQVFVQLNAARLGSYTAIATNAYFEPETALSSGTVVIVTCLTSIAHPNIAPAFLGAGNVMVIGAQADVLNSWALGYQTGLYGQAINGVLGDVVGVQQRDVQRIDQKIDDGYPNSGTFGLLTSTPNANSPNNPANCTTGSNSYPVNASNCLVVAGKVIKSF